MTEQPELNDRERARVREQRQVRLLQAAIVAVFLSLLVIEVGASVIAQLQGRVFAIDSGFWWLLGGMVAAVFGVEGLDRFKNGKS